MNEGQSTLSEVICNTASTVTLEGASKIAIASAYRVSCEGWLKAELLFGLTIRTDFDDDTEVFVERDRIDLQVRSPAETVLVELKTFPTNYGGAGKPITNFVDGVIRDLEKLASVREVSQTGLVLWMAYPIPDPEPEQWAKHLSRIKAAAADTLLAERIPILSGDFANLYGMTSF